MVKLEIPTLSESPPPRREVGHADIVGPTQSEAGTGAAALGARAQGLRAGAGGTRAGGGPGPGRSGGHRPASQAPPDQLSFFQPEHPLIARLRALELEHGDLVPLMRRIKDVFDPHGIMNPGKLGFGTPR